MKRALVILVLFSSSVARAELDTIHQDVVVDITGPAIRVDLTLELRVRGTADALEMLTPSLPVLSVTVDGAAATVMPHPSSPADYSYIAFPRAFTNNQTALVHMILEGAPSCTSTRGLLCVHNDDETILVPMGTGITWAFVNVFETDPFLGGFQVIAPPDKLVVAPSGKAQSVVTGADGDKTWTYGLVAPTDALFVYARTGSEVRGPMNRVLGYHAGNASDDAAMHTAVNLGEELLPFFEGAFGPLPIDEVHLMAVPPGFPFGGMGLLGNVMFGDYVLNTHDYLLEQGVAHELAHSWWGNLASAKSYEESLVLHEAMAEYSAWRMMGKLRGDDVRRSGVRMNSVWYMLGRPSNADVAPLDPDVSSASTAIFAGYHKASSVMRTLEELVGKEAFEQALKATIETGFELSIAGLIEQVRVHSGVDVTGDVNQWLRRTGYPRMSVGSTTAPSAEGVEVTVSVEESGDFAFNLPVRFVLSDGSEHWLVARVTEGSTTHTMSLPSSPVLVQADPEWSLVRGIGPARGLDVTLDGELDAADLVEIALNNGGVMPTVRRVDGHYDPLFDVDGDGRISDADLEAVLQAAGG